MNNGNQLTHRDWSGKLDILGSVSDTNAVILDGQGGTGTF